MGMVVQRCDGPHLLCGSDDDDDDDDLYQVDF